MEKEVLMSLGELKGQIGAMAEGISGIRRDGARFEAQQSSLSDKLDAVWRATDALRNDVASINARVDSLETRVSSKRLEETIVFVDRWRGVWGWLLGPVNGVAQKAVYGLIIAAVAAAPTVYLAVNKEPQVPQQAPLQTATNARGRE